MNSDTSFNEAKQLYLEKYGDAIVTNNYLKIALALLAIVALGLIVMDLRTIQVFRSFRPLVIRIDELGRAQAVDYKSLEYHPGDREAKYFLSEFCRLYNRRNRYTIHDDFTKALYFLDGRLANETIQLSKKDDTIRAFLNNPSAPKSMWTSRRSHWRPCKNLLTAPRRTSSALSTLQLITLSCAGPVTPRTSFFSSKTTFPAS